MRLNLSMGALAALQLIASILVQLSIIRIVGMGHLTDAFIAAQSVPLVLFSIISVSISSVWQPRLSILLNNQKKWREDLGVAQGQALILFLIIAIPIGIFSEFWINQIFPGLDANQVKLTALMTLPLLASSAFNTHSALIITALRGRDRFLRGEVFGLIGTVFSLVIIYLVVPSNGIVAASWIILMRAIAVFIALYLTAQQPNFLLRQAWKSQTEWRGIKSLLAGSSLYKTSPLIDRYWSSQAGAGSITVLNLAQTAMGAIANIVERAICVPAAPRLARFVECRDYQGLKKTYRACVLYIALMTAMTALAFAVIYPVWEFLLMEALKVTPSLAREMWIVCLALLGYLYVAGSGTIVVSAFYAMGDTRTPVRVGVIGFLFGIAIKSIGFIKYGILGLAVATSIYYVCNMMAMCILLEKKIAKQIS